MVKAGRKGKEESDLEGKISQYLDREERKDKTFIDVGVSLDGEEYFFGVKVETEFGVRPAIVTSNKKFLINTRHKVKTDEGDVWEGTDEITPITGDYQWHLGDLAPRWSRPIIKKYLQDKIEVNPVEIFNEVKNELDKYLDFPNNGTSSVIATWTIATYFYPLWDWFPHMLAHAPSGSGKTKLCNCVRLMGFAGFDIGASGGCTPPQLFRTLEGNRGVSIFDEFEQQEKSEIMALVNQILNAGCTKESYVVRLERIGNKHVPKKFPIYCPKFIANISGLNPTTLSRCIIIPMLRTQSAKANLQPLKKKAQANFKEIRDKLHIFALENWKEIQKKYENIDTGMVGRTEDNWRPLYVIADLIDPKIKEELTAYIEETKDLESSTDNNNDIKANFFLGLLEILPEKGYMELTAKEWAEKLPDAFESVKNPTITAAHILKSSRFKKRHSRKGAEYRVSKSEVKYLYDLYFAKTVPHQKTLVGDGCDGCDDRDTAERDGKREGIIGNNNKIIINNNITSDNPSQPSQSSPLSQPSQPSPSLVKLSEPHSGPCGLCGSSCYLEFSYDGNHICRGCRDGCDFEEVSQ